jgi:hypothetical protein
MIFLMAANDGRTLDPSRRTTSWGLFFAASVAGCRPPRRRRQSAPDLMLRLRRPCRSVEKFRRPAGHSWQPIPRLPDRPQ